MADTVMATVSAVGPAGVGMPTGGLEAVKYAAQAADTLQDDPNFYTWLEDWIGKQDEESVMIDAFNTLTDYGMQFDFQQQQQQMQKVEHHAGQAATNDTTGADAAALLPLSSPAPQGHAPGGTSSCASVASHPFSQPSSDDPSLGGLGSPSNSSFANSGAPLCTTVAMSPVGACRASTRGPAAAAGPVSDAGSGGNAATAAAASPFDTSFTVPLSRGLDPFGLSPELRRLLGRPAAAACTSLSLLELISPPGAARPADRLPSHGTVTSYAGTPPPPPAPPPAASTPAATGPAAAAASAGLLGAGGGGLQPPSGLPSVPSLEQLIVRAICGNGSGISAGGGSGGGGGGGGDLGSIEQALLGGALGPTATTSRSNGAGCCGSATMGVGLAASASAPLFPLRNASNGSFGADGAGDCIVRSMDEDLAPCGSGRPNSQDLPSYLPPGQPQNHHQPLRCISGMSGGAGGEGTGDGTTAARKSFSGAHPSAHVHTNHHHHHHHHPHHHHHHPHHHGIPVSLVHGHGHVGKTASGAAGGLTAGAAGSGGGAHARGSGRASASGKPTRTARAKAVFAALEAEVAGKLSELEALQREHATLTQRVEILEVAVERQDAVLQLMSTAGRAAAATSAAAPAPAGPAGIAAAAAAAEGGARPAAAAGGELLEWARRCTLELVVDWYKEHLQNMSLALLALEDSAPNPEAELRLVQMVAAGWVRMTLVCIFQPLIQLRLKGLNLETNCYAEPPEQHWIEVIKFMSVGPAQVAEMENLFHSYTLLHGSFRAELQDTQRELTELVAAQDRISRDHCSKRGLEFVLQQMSLLKRVRSILQKTHLLYSSTIGVAALRVLKPKEYAKCCVQSYPYYPCGPSLMKACATFKAVKAIWGAAAVGCDC